MNPALFFKVATSGLPLFNQPSEDPNQPHMVQLAAVLMDLDSRSMISCLDVIIRPDGWELPAEASNVNGITTQTAKQLGVGEVVALNLLLDMWSCATVRIAHGQAFDARIVRIAMKRHIVPAMAADGERFADQWKDAPAVCTAKLAKELCGLPKQPKLEEAFALLNDGAKLESNSANEALQAVISIYFALKDHEASTGQQRAA